MFLNAAQGSLPFVLFCRPLPIPSWQTKRTAPTPPSFTASHSQLSTVGVLTQDEVRNRLSVVPYSCGIPQRERGPCVREMGDYSRSRLSPMAVGDRSALKENDHDLKSVHVLTDVRTHGLIGTTGCSVHFSALFACHRDSPQIPVDPGGETMAPHAMGDSIF